MKYFLLLFSFILLLSSFGVQEKSLYLIFSKDDTRIKKFHFASDKYLTFTYDLKFREKKYKTVVFDETEPIKKDTIAIDRISDVNPKDIDWLTKKYLEHYNYFKGEHPRIDKDGTIRAFDLNEMYESIYIIIPDSCANEAVITQVKYNPAFSID